MAPPITTANCVQLARHPQFGEHPRFARLDLSMSGRGIHAESSDTTNSGVTARDRARIIQLMQ